MLHYMYTNAIKQINNTLTHVHPTLHQHMIKDFRNYMLHEMWKFNRLEITHIQNIHVQVGKTLHMCVKRKPYLKTKLYLIWSIIIIPTPTQQYPIPQISKTVYC